jgi:hypothetical protein
MRRWRVDDNELVISVLSERALGMWVASFQALRVSVYNPVQVSMGV